MPILEISRIKDETVRQVYKRALRRRDYIASSVKDAFGAHRAPMLMGFTDESAFSANARFGDDAYVIEVTKAVPLLLLLLFEKLLSDRQLFPWIDAAEPSVEAYEVGFVVDPGDFANRERWNVHLTAQRSFAAGKLADVMVASASPSMCAGHCGTILPRFRTMPN